jgi:hypothetical protein
MFANVHASSEGSFVSGQSTTDVRPQSSASMAASIALELLIL